MSVIHVILRAFSTRLIKKCDFYIHLKKYIKLHALRTNINLIN
jgi:hypothetical protein